MNRSANSGINAFIRRIRKETGYNQTEVANALFITRSAYSRKEHGQTPFFPEELLPLAKVFGFAPDIFFEPELWDCSLPKLRQMEFEKPDLTHLGELTADELKMIENYRKETIS